MPKAKGAEAASGAPRVTLPGLERDGSWALPGPGGCRGRGCVCARAGRTRGKSLLLSIVSSLGKKRQGALARALFTARATKAPISARLHSQHAVDARHPHNPFSRLRAQLQLDLADRISFCSKLGGGRARKRQMPLDFSGLPSAPCPVPRGCVGAKVQKSAWKAGAEAGAGREREPEPRRHRVLKCPGDASLSCRHGRLRRSEGPAGSSEPS